MASSQARILVVGGGFGGLFTALELASAGEVTLVSNEDHFLFTPMLYEYLSGEVEAWHIAPHYKELIDDRIRFILGAVTEIDFAARQATIAGRVRRVDYDVLVLAVGGITNFWGIEGAESYALPFRKLRHADDLRRRMIDTLDRIAPDADPQDAHNAATFAIVGAGASGVELSTKMSDLLRDAFKRRGLRGESRLLILEMGEQVVPGMDVEMRGVVERALNEAHVEVHTSTRVKRVLPDGVVIEHDGAETEIKSSAVVWTAGVRVSPLVEGLKVAKDRRGLIYVEPTLQVRGFENVFALGDIAFSPNVAPILAGTAQLAFQQSDLVGKNVRALLKGGEPATKRFVEMGEALSLGTEGGAVLAGGRVVSGALARQARFALYTQRLPTWQHRLRVGASWFFGGTPPRPLGL
ncbi:MAG: NAD(P)/FAD-dependent oxidoreductase [Pyrinomonadaceae bacterium]|nr:NAD(P)/FAD-dependent oxidoreductase [Pyrinomonadaceae bacterium]MDQ3585763.1 NAD(P)/FAD-dependent oxidoreductase [Acidobacteriota bacterium]